jgi:hypothetical protein
MSEIKPLDCPGDQDAATGATGEKEETCAGTPRTFRDRPAFTPGNITSLAPDEIFVFGSSFTARHRSGAGLTAFQKFGAIPGQGNGLQGQSYGIPTMHGGPGAIAPFVDEFIDFARGHPEKFFYVTRVGCGIAGFSDAQMAPLFKKALHLDNVYLPESFARALEGRQIPGRYKEEHVQM